MARVFIEKLVLVKDHHLNGTAKIFLMNINFHIAKVAVREACLFSRTASISFSHSTCFTISDL